jgi:hypothetical protein
MYIFQSVLFIVILILLAKIALTLRTVSYEKAIFEVLGNEEMCVMQITDKINKSPNLRGRIKSITGFANPGDVLRYLNYEMVVTW